MGSVSGRAGGPGKAQGAAAPLSFAAWFARRVRLEDAAFSALDLLLMNAAHSTQMLWGLACSGPGVAAAPELARLPAQLAGLLASFPCGAGFAQRTGSALTSNAYLNVRLLSALGDYGNAVHILGCVAMTALALCAPGLHARCRTAVCFLHSASIIAGWQASATLSSTVLLPFLGAGTLTAARRCIGALYLGWKAVTVYRASWARICRRALALACALLVQPCPAYPYAWSD